VFLGLSQLFIFVIIAAQFSLYIFIRQVVNTKEWLSACESNYKSPQFYLTLHQGGVGKAYFVDVSALREHTK